MKIKIMAVVFVLIGVLPVFELVCAAPGNTGSSTPVSNESLRSDMDEQVSRLQNQIAGDEIGPDGQFEVASYAGEFNTIGEHTSLREYILNVLNFFLSFLGLVCVAATIYAGFLLVSSQGDDSKMEEAKKLITYVVIGIIIILMSFALVNTVIQNAGTGGDDRGESVPEETINRRSGTTNNVLGGSPSLTTPFQQSVVDRLLHVNPIVIHGIENTQIKELGLGTWIAPEYALSGVRIGLSRQADAIIYYGDGLQERINTIDNRDATVSHIFVHQGEQVLRVIAQEADRATSYNTTLYIGGIESVIKAPLVAKPGDLILLEGTLSKTLVGGITHYDWICPESVEGCADGDTSIAVFTQAGTYSVKLTITTNFGVSRTATHTIQVVAEEEELPVNFSY